MPLHAYQERKKTNSPLNNNQSSIFLADSVMPLQIVLQRFSTFPSANKAFQIAKMVTKISKLK